MSDAQLNPDNLAALTALANGIIPPDQTDAGAETVHAAAALAEKIRNGVNATLYAQGLATAEQIAGQRFARAVRGLGPEEIHALLGELQKVSPAFFKQLRMDVSA